MCVLLVSEDFVQDPPDEEEKSMKRKYYFTIYIHKYIYQCSLYNVLHKTYAPILYYRLLH